LIANGELLDFLPLGILLFNEAFEIVYHNQNVFYFGIKRSVFHAAENAVPLKLATIIPGFPSNDEIGKLKHGDAIEKELRSQKSIDGGEISVILKAVPLFNDDAFKGGLILLEDLKVPATIAQKKQDYMDDYFEPIIGSIWSLFLLITPDGKVMLSGGNKISAFARGQAGSGGNIYEFFRDELQEKIIPTFRACLSKRKTEEFIIDINVDGEEDGEEYFECQILPLTGENGRTSFAFISIREITVFLKMIEQYKRENSELSNVYRFNQIISTAIFAIAGTGKIIFWNRATENLLNLRRSEVFGKHVSRILPYFTEEKIAEVLESLQTSDSIVIENEFMVIHSEPKKLKFCLHKVVEDGETAIVFEGSDISRDLEQQETMSAELRFYSQFYDLLELPAIRLSTDGYIKTMNPAFREMLGYQDRREQVLFFMDLIPQEYIIGHDLTFRSLVADGSTQMIPLRISRNSIRTFRITFLSKNGQHEDSIGCILRDVDDQLRFEAEYRKFKSVFELSSDGLALMADNKFTMVNEAFRELLAYSTIDEFTDLDALTIVAEEDLPRMRENFAKLLPGHQNATRFDFVAARKDGGRLYLSTTVTPFLFEDKQFYLIAARDTTELKRVQQAIKESEERYRSITDNIEDFFWSSDRSLGNSVSTFYSSSVQKITGYTQEEFLTDSKFFFTIIYPDDFKTVKERLQRFYHNIYKRSDEIEFRIMNKNGNVVWVRNKISVIRDRKGNPTKIFGLVSDISAQKKAEDDLRAFTENLQKLNETKDKFISIISHDLRTPFSSILGFTDLLLNEDDLTPEESRQYIQYIQESSQNMLSLVNSLLDWTRIQTGRIQFEPAPVQFQPFVQKVLTGMTGYAMQKKIDLVNEIPEDISLMIDQNLVMQALNNLLSNALKFTGEGGSITISCSQSEQPRFMQVAVTDTGKGIRPEDIEKIFSIESKFTTEGTAGEKGTGLGLTLVKEIVEKHRGKIWAESDFGLGTTFYFTLPKASALILLVDDSSTDRILYTKILKNIVGDYDVVTASNGKEALQQLQKVMPALIVCDHAMPVMNGFEFMQAYNSLHIKGKPPVVILSGDIGKSEQITYSEMGVEYVFTKPVNLTSFKKAIERSLKQIPLT
jgi:PAS domain S-box-containing protein